MYLALFKKQKKTLLTGPRNEPLKLQYTGACFITWWWFKNFDHAGAGSMVVLPWTVSMRMMASGSGDSHSGNYSNYSG